MDIFAKYSENEILESISWFGQCTRGKIMPLGEAGQRVHGNSLYYFCNFCESAYITKVIENKLLENKNKYKMQFLYFNHWSQTDVKLLCQISIKVSKCTLSISTFVLWWTNNREVHRPHECEC